MSETEPTSEAQAVQALNRLTQEVERLNTHRFVTLHNRPFRLILFQFARGLAFGLGTALGATILVSLIGWWFSQFEFLPVIGEWASEIAKQIEAAR